MFKKKVKDIMIPISLYPTIHKDATMLEAMKALRTFQEKAPKNIQPYRAVLVLDDTGKVIGKVGQLSFLKGFEPKYNRIFDIEKLSRASLSAMYLDSMMEHFNLWDEEEIDVCRIANEVKVTDIMHPVEENVDENASLAEAIHKIIMWNCLSLLVISGNEIVGIIRLSDIYSALEEFAINSCNVNNK